MTLGTVARRVVGIFPLKYFSTDRAAAVSLDLRRVSL